MSLTVVTLFFVIEHLKKGVYFSRVDEIEVKWFDTLQDPLSDFSIL